MPSSPHSSAANTADSSMPQTPTVADERAIRRENRQRLIAYFESGCKSADLCMKLGVEVEHFVLTDDARPVPYAPNGDHLGVAQVLEQLEPYYPEKSYSADGSLIGLLGEEGSVTLEPAAQLELSAAPYTQVSDIDVAFTHFYQHVASILEPAGCHLQAAGYHPSRKALDLTLIPKQRYRYMSDYFAYIGSHGERMMRASASTQVSVDYSSEADAVRKMRVAAALAPVLAAIMDNTQVFEGETNGTPIRRLRLWREVDNRRCGTPRGLFEPSFGFAANADWLLETSPIFVDRPAVNDPDGPSMRPGYDTPSADLYVDAPMSKDDLEHLISMFWPDVRLKKFVEVRPADSVPLPQVLGYAALVKGLFYSETSLAAIEDAIGVERGISATASLDGGASTDRWPLDADAVNAAVKQIQARGFSGDVYGKTLADWEQLLFDLARAALPEDEKAYLDPLEAFAHDKDWWDVTA
jgi:glutamate--cysteine ligase